MLVPLSAASRTPSQGATLAAALGLALGVGYSQPIHLIGHSLGSYVNKHAADCIMNGKHSDGEVCAQLPSVTTVQVTALLDAPELALLGSPMPRNATWVDNYVSAFGAIKSGAANATLPEASNARPFDLPFAHSYSWIWYACSIQPARLASDGFGNSYDCQGEPRATPPLLGFAWAIENGDTVWSRRPSGGTVLSQTRDTSDSILNLTDTLFLPFRSSASMVVLGASAEHALELHQPLRFARSQISHIRSLHPDDAVAPIRKTGPVDLISREDGRLIATFTAVASAGLWVPVQVPADAQFVSWEVSFRNCKSQYVVTIGIGDTALGASPSND